MKWQSRQPINQLDQITAQVGIIEMATSGRDIVRLTQFQKV